MAETKFTPGPWHVDDRRSAPLPNILVVGADYSHVAEASGVHMRDKMVRWKPEDANAADARAMANAQLIAAAPALYEACQAIENGILVCPNCDGSGCYAVGPTDDPEPEQCEFCYTVPNSMFNLRQKACAALALATEETK